MNRITQPQSFSTAERGIDSCHFCTIVAGESRQEPDLALLESKSYVAIPSIGSLVPGWVLILPRRHMPNLAHSHLDQGLINFRLEVARLLNRAFGVTVRMFEHGATKSGSATGCGVNHGHLHLVPIKEDVQSSISEIDLPLDWQASPLSQAHTKLDGKEYLLYCDDASTTDPVCQVAILDQPISQFFRRVIAKTVGRPDRYDYRSFPHPENIQITRSRWLKLMGDHKASALVV